MAYVTDGDLKGNVHYAAAIAVCKAAGCVVTGIEGQPLHTGVGRLLVAADEETHSTLLDIIRTILHSLTTGAAACYRTQWPRRGCAGS